MHAFGVIGDSDSQRNKTFACLSLMGGQQAFKQDLQLTPDISGKTTCF